ncbi:MAG: 4-hydroxy-tetrahydrodipicolinate reductase [Flavobacteriales bacterium]
MKIALIGYGKMGVEVEKIAQERGHSITLRADSQSGIDEDKLSHSEVAIEFTNPAAAPQNIITCLRNKIPVVSGSTGWYDKLPGIKTQFEKENGTLLHATNFSLGVNLFFALNAFLADKLNTYGGYGIHVHEIHHTKKLDAPSGTAITTAETLIKHMDFYTGWKHGREHAQSEIPVTHERVDDVPGTHTVKFTGADDEIEIKHTAHNRMGFALGAVIAAEWIIGKHGVFTMRDVLKIDF